jgi:hypothetical protein
MFGNMHYNLHLREGVAHLTLMWREDAQPTYPKVNDYHSHFRAAMEVRVSRKLSFSLPWPFPFAIR